MQRLTHTVLIGIGLVPAVLSATLLASHYNGQLYSLSLTMSSANSSLAITSQATGCGTTPGRLELYPDIKALYCFDESWKGSGFMAVYSVADDGKLTMTAQTPTTGNDVHGTLYDLYDDGPRHGKWWQPKAGNPMAVGGQTSSNVAILQRDPATGKLGNVVANLQLGTVGRAGEEDGLSAVVWVE